MLLEQWLNYQMIWLLLYSKMEDTNFYTMPAHEQENQNANNLNDYKIK